jgi:N4-gp56 family major capsid protein
LPCGILVSTKLKRGKIIKTKNLFHRIAFAIFFTASLAMLTATQSAEAFFNVAHTNPVLGDYAKVNVSTVANLVALDPKAQEELWVKRVMMGADQDNIFYDNMIGGPGSGKPFIRQDDLSKVDGNTINISNMAPLGGPGTQGEGDRIGNEEKLRIGSFPVRIGRQWYGVGITDVAKEETIIGGQFDNLVNRLLRKRLGKKKSEDMLMILKATATASNIIRPNFKPTRESLRTADTIGTTTITKAGLVLSGLGGTPVKIGKSEVGADIEQYLFFGHQYALSTLKSESAYLQAITNAGVRGGANPLFRGDFSSWDGHGIYRWMLKDHDAYGSVGSTLLPRAFLGEAITASDTAPEIKGGGEATAANIIPKPLYFEFFSNALYTFTNGNSVAADTTTVRYVAILNMTGADAGKIGFYSYKVNDGNKITAFKRLRAAAAGDALTTVGNVTWNVAPWVLAGAGNFAGLTDAHPAGSLIVETNSYGVPFCGSLMLAEAAGVCGHGSLKGRNAMGARTEEHRNHNMDHGIGIETVYGTAATKRTDGKTPNYVYVESAYQVDGFPTVT